MATNCIVTDDICIMIGKFQSAVLAYGQELQRTESVMSHLNHMEKKYLPCALGFFSNRTMHTRSNKNSIRWLESNVA